MRKRITYDKTTKDWAMYLNGAFVGYAPTPQEARERLNQIAYKKLQHGN